MRDLIHKILSALNFKGRDWVVFLLALLLAFSIWLIRNLSLEYNDYLSVSVTATCNIPGHSIESANRCDITARCRATGFRILRSVITKRLAHSVSFRTSDMKHYEDDMFYITSSELNDYAHKIFGTGVSAEYFLSDTLFFRFPHENFKSVPVIPISSISYRDQYMPDGSLNVEPDSVLIYAEPYRLESVEEVYTKPINYSDLSKDVRGVVSLERIKGVRFSVDEVRYSLNVKRFVEINLSLPVNVVNVPENRSLKVYPSYASVRLRCNFPLTEDPEASLEVEADYDDYVKSLSGRCPLTLKGLSRGIISYEIEPVSVSGVIEEIR